MAECSGDSNGAGIKDSRTTLEDEPDRDEDDPAHGRAVGLDGL